MTRRRRVLSAILIFATLTLVLFLAGIVVVQSGWFKNKVRERIVAEIEKTTGGRVEIGSFDYDWRHSTAEVAPFILHGKESAGAPPLFRAATIRVGLKIISFVERRADIASVSIDKPEIHVFVNPDGTTNLPTPRAVSEAR